MQKLKNFIKNSTIFSYIYRTIFFVIYFLLDNFLKKKKKIIFTSFSGRQYSDSPKVIFEAMKNDERFQEYEFVWGFNTPEEFKFIGSKNVNINKFEFLIELFSSTVWISNASIEKLIPYKSSKILYLNTWHGIPLKKIGKDQENVGKLIKKWYNNVEFDLLTTCSDYDEKIFKQVFPKTKNYIRTGLPRNMQLLINDNQKHAIRRDFCRRYGLPYDTRLILYAPTFREYTPSISNPIFDGNITPNLNSNSVMLLRTHYFEKVYIDNKKVINVSEENLDELMIVSDCLITDYSSLMFDYFLLDKPIYMFAYDYEEYRNNRGFYVDLKADYKIPILNQIDIKNIFLHDVSEKQLNSYFKQFNSIKTVDIETILKVLHVHLSKK